MKFYDDEPTVVVEPTVEVETTTDDVEVTAE
jgi:hypothetical protein